MPRGYAPETGVPSRLAARGLRYPGVGGMAVSITADESGMRRLAPKLSQRQLMEVNKRATRAVARFILRSIQTIWDARTRGTWTGAARKALAVRVLQETETGVDYAVGYFPRGGASLGRKTVADYVSHVELGTAPGYSTIPNIDRIRYWMQQRAIGGNISVSPRSRKLAGWLSTRLGIGQEESQRLAVLLLGIKRKGTPAYPAFTAVVNRGSGGSFNNVFKSPYGQQAYAVWQAEVSRYLASLQGS